MDDLTIYGGVFCKVWNITEARVLLEQHVHDYDHLTILVWGRIRVFSAGDDWGIFNAPALIKIPANTPHQFVSLSDNVTLACVHAVGVADKES